MLSLSLYQWRRLWIGVSVPLILSAATSIAAFSTSLAGAPEFPLQEGVDDFRISSMGPGGASEDPSFSPALEPPAVELADGSTTGVVAWVGNDRGFNEVFVRRIDVRGGFALGSEVSALPFGRELRTDRVDLACDFMRDRCLVGWTESRSDPSGSDEFLMLLRPFRASTLEMLGDPVEVTETVSNTGIATPHLEYSQVDDVYRVIAKVSFNLVGGTPRVQFFLIPGDWGPMISPVSQSAMSLPFDRSTVQTTWDAIAGKHIVVGRRVVDTENRDEVFAGYLGDKFADFVRVSNTEGSGDGRLPSIAHDPATGRSLIVWIADDNPGTIRGEFEVYGQFVEQAADGTLGLFGADDFRISSVGPDGNEFRDATEPAVAFDGLTQRFVVTWSADDSDFFLANGEFEVFLQTFDTLGNPQRSVPLRVSRMGGPDQAGGTGDSAWITRHPGVATSTGRAIVAWWGRNQLFPIFFGDSWTEDEIWGQLVLLEDLPPVRVTVQFTATLGGSVASEPAGISCPSDCSETYATGDTVTLTASATPGFTFAGWSGACSGIGACELFMLESDATVGAAFTAQDGLFLDGFESPL